VTEAAFMANLSTAGACITSSDADSVCTKNVTAAAQTCGSGCFAMGGDVPTQDACTSSCIAGMVTPLSSDCLNCYVADVACARAHCLVKCGTAPMSTDCADCRETNGCTSDFYTCAGVPMPSGAPSGGTSG
jgi:hypothetical protein